MVAKQKVFFITLGGHAGPMSTRDESRGALPFVFDAARVNRRSPFDFAQGRLSTSLRSGRDDNFVAECELLRKIIDLKILPSRPSLRDS